MFTEGQRFLDFARNDKGLRILKKEWSVTDDG